MRPRGHGVRRRRHGPHPDLVRQLPRESHRSAGADPELRRRRSSAARPRPAPLGAAWCPAEGLRLAGHPRRRPAPDPRGLRRDGLAGRPAAAARRAPPRDRGLRRRPDAAHRQGRRRVPRSRRPAAEGRLNFAVGFDNIDVAGLHGARASRSATRPGVLTETTADLAWALLMAAARRLAEGDRYVRDGKWKTWGPMLLMGPDVHGATIGIVGFGRIGQAVARRAHGLRDADPLPRPAAGQPGRSRRSSARRSMTLEELLPEVRLRVAPRQPEPADAAASSTPSGSAG